MNLLHCFLKQANSQSTWLWPYSSNLVTLKSFCRGKPCQLPLPLSTSAFRASTRAIHNRASWISSNDSAASFPQAIISSKLWCTTPHLWSVTRSCKGRSGNNHRSRVHNCQSLDKQRGGVQDSRVHGLRSKLLEVNQKCPPIICMTDSSFIF